MSCSIITLACTYTSIFAAYFQYVRTYLQHGIISSISVLVRASLDAHWVSAGAYVRHC